MDSVASPSNSEDSVASLGIRGGMDSREALVLRASKDGLCVTVNIRRGREMSESVWAPWGLSSDGLDGAVFWEVGSLSGQGKCNGDMANSGGTSFCSNSLEREPG